MVESGLPKEKVVVLKRQIRKIVNGFDIEHATLEIEREGEDCILKDCQWFNSRNLYSGDEIGEEEAAGLW